MTITSSILENNIVKLIPLEEKHTDVLKDIAFEKDLISYSPSDISSTEKLQKYINQAIHDKEIGTTIPYLIFDKRTQQYIGSTRFGFINSKNKTLHIGWTWISKKAQGTGINKLMKFLMLHYAFEVLKFEKVDFRIDERNIRSRKAVEKIGGTLEGLLRKDTLMLDGFRRSTCCYGILKEEWPLIKKTNFNNL
jgi:RimJ/RimL family protein N-acetyltransferase